MKQSFLITALCATASLALSVTPAGAVNVNYTPGDLIVGFHATGGMGATNTYVFNLGSTIGFRDGTITGQIANINTDLAATYGANWFTRTDLYWGAIGNRTNAGFGQNATTVNGDPTQTIYVSTDTATPGSSVRVSFDNGPAVGAASTTVQGFLAGGGFQGNTATGTPLTNNNGAVVPTSATNDWTEYNPVGGPGFGAFNGGIESVFGPSTDPNYLDIYRLISRTDGDQFNASESDIGQGRYITTLAIDQAGNISAVPEPSSMMLLGLGALAFGAARRRRKA